MSNLLKFRWLTQTEWNRIQPGEHDMRTKYTIWDNDKNEILYEWVAGNVFYNSYSKEEIDDKLKNWKVDGGNLDG